MVSSLASTVVCRAVLDHLAAVHEHVSHVACRRREHHRVERVLGIDVPASCTPSSATVTRSARAPGSMRPASGQPRQACPCSVAARISDSVVWTPRRPPASRSSSSTARASSNRSMNACESEPSESVAPAPARLLIAPIPSARSRSVVGQTQQHAPASPSSRTSASSRCVACTAVKLGLQCTGIGEQGRGSAAVGVEAGLVLGGLLRDVRVQRATALACPRGHHRGGVRVDRAHAVDRRADPHGVRVAQRVDALRPRLRASIGETPLRALDGRPDSAVEVAGVDQRQPDPGVRRRRHQHPAHLVRVVVRGAARPMVQVVELADGRDPREGHLRVGRARDGEVALGIEPLGRRVHLLPPRPEVAAAVVRAAAQHALEGVRMRVG